MAPHAERIDLHAHSDASDGALPPRALVARAAALGLSAVALTDHDTTAGLRPALAAGAELGVRVVPGVELSAGQDGGEVHILGLFVDPGREPGRLAELRRRRRERIVRMLERLAGLGVRLEPEAVLAAAGGETSGEERVLGRPHVARALVAAGAVKTVAEAFSRYLRDQGPADAPKEKISAGEAVELIHGMGGLALLAHPGINGAEARLDALRALGLDGVEAYHPKHSGETVARLLRWAGAHRMAVSGGSDFHLPEAGQELGKPPVPASVLDGLLERNHKQPQQGQQLQQGQKPQESR